MNGYPGPHYAYAYEQHRRHFEPPGPPPGHPSHQPSPYATYLAGPPPPPPQYQHMPSPYTTYPTGPPPPQYHSHGPLPHAYSHVPPSPSLSSSSSVSSELAGLSFHNQTTEPAASVESGAEKAKSSASPPRSKKERLMARMATPSPSPLDANMMPPRTPSPSNSSTSLTSSSVPTSPTSSPSPSKNNGKWTESEDAVLRAAVAANSARNWKKIASSLSNRTDVQCLHRWQKVLRPGLVKGPWTADEDCRLVELIQQYGVRRWSFLATQHHTGRLGKQCRERWYNHLDPVINKGPWTRAEDDAVMAAYEEMGSKWARIAKAVGNGRTDNAIKNRWNSMLRRVVKGEIARPSYADEETKEEEGQATPSTGGRQKKRSRESVDDAIDYDLLSKDRGQCTPAELDQIRRERNRLHSRRSRERKRARFAAAEQNSIRKVSTATPPPPSPLTLDEHASSAPSTPSTLADTFKSIRSDLSNDDAIAAEALSTLIGTTNTTKSMNHVPRPVSVTNTPSPVTSVISYSSDAEASTSTASDAYRTPTVPRQRREEASTEGMSDLTLPALPSSSVVGRYPQLPLSLGATRKASSKDEFLKVVSRTSSTQGGVEDAVGLLLHFNNHTRTLQYHTGQ